MSATFDREEVRRGLDLLYPADNGIIELDILKKNGALLSCRSANRDLVVDEIEKHDPQDDTTAIYTSLNRLDPATFTQEGHVLSIDEPVGPGRRINASNVARVTSILLDIDPFRANDDKKDSTTDAEHEAAIKAADFLKHRLSFLGWPEPVVGDSGNGAALRYACSLPASKETTDLLSRALRAANAMLPAEMAKQVEVDVAVFDLPRISKVFGTVTRKGPGTTERPHRRAAIISAPSELEPVSIDCIIKLAGTSKAQEEQSEPQQEQERKGEAEPLSPDAAERLQELFAADPIFKAELFAPAPTGERSDAEFHYCCRLWEAGFTEQEIYSIMCSSPQTKWLERGDSYRWSTIKAAVAAAEANHKEREEKARNHADEEDGYLVCHTFARDPYLKIEEIVVIHYDDKGNVKKKIFSPTFASVTIPEKMPLVMSEESDDIYRLNGKIYRSDGARAIDKILCTAAGDLITADKLKETLRRIKNDLLDRPVVFEPNPYLLGVENGVADLLTGEVRPYRPPDLMLEQIAVKYDPAARCPEFLAFLESITPNISDRITLIDWFVANAIKEPLPYVLFLLGLGRNGKGVYEKILKKFFGKAAFRDMPLAEVGKNNFAAGGFYRKRGWIASETGKRKAVIDTDFMKLTSGNGSIDADRKNQSRIQFDPYFQTTVDTNTMPQINDKSRGWIERFCKVDLPYSFLANPDTDNPLEKQRDPDLFEKLSTESELSGILNLLLFRSKAIGRSKQIHKRQGSEMFAEYAEQSSSVASFLDLFCEYDGALSGLWTPSEKIYESYCEWCRYKVGEVVDVRYFGRQLKMFCGGIDPKKGKTKDRKNIRLYKGLTFDSSKFKSSIAVSISLHKSPLCIHEEEEEIDISKHNVSMSPLKLWKEIIERFGNSSNVHNCTLHEKSLYKEPTEKITETMETMETSLAGEPVGEEVNGDQRILQRRQTPGDDQPGVGPHPRREEATTLEKLRIIKQDGYRTQIPSPDDPNKFIDHLFNCGDVAEFQHWKAVELIKRGVAVAEA